MPAKKIKKQNDALRYFIHFSYYLIIVIFLLVATFNFHNYFTAKKVLGASIDNNPLQKEMEYWQKIVEKSPTYVDGYLELAKINVQLGFKRGGEFYIEKARELDPNSSKIPEVASILGL